ncbi:hypothetical protein KA013_02135 [Patescibacteria group bacterium]|nr:hypothetical protein [Patescibacteria group bacterium]
MAVSPDPQRPEKMMNDLTRSLNQYNYIGLNSLAYHQDNDLIGFMK